MPDTGHIPPDPASTATARPRLTVVIVNYNVKHFLEQALRSVEKAAQRVATEVYVVDNNSVDGSQAMLREKFPHIHSILNTDNPGFSKANNQAIRISTGDYVLLLNPDTVVEEDTFRQMVDFMDAHPDAGGLGCKMINGKGEFLPESKRALPTPWVAFYKIFGLSKLFPNSKRFGRYHLTYLDADQTHEVEVLSGACMLMRRTALDKVGLLDEDFFMYGEDIDLSYRITLGGYKNYYLATARIIHYKGESTKKGSLNYVLVFYQAMLIFARKHFSSSSGQLYMLIIRLAIYIRMAAALLRRLANLALLPLLDFGAMYGAILGIRYVWESAVMHAAPGTYYPADFNHIAAPLYAGMYVLAHTLAGNYRRPWRVRRVLAGAAAGVVAIATLTFLVKEINFSRGIVAASGGAAAVLGLGLRGLWQYATTGSPLFHRQQARRYLLVGLQPEAGRVLRLLQQDILYPYQYAGLVQPDTAAATPDEGVLGTTAQLAEIARFYQAGEIIFCNQGMTSQEIIGCIDGLAGTGIEFKIVPPGADYIIGPSQTLAGSGAQALLSRLLQPENRLQKRAFDAAAASVLLLLYPLSWWVYRHPGQAARGLWQVLAGRYHLVGYAGAAQPGLPKLKTGLLNLKTLYRQRGAQPADGNENHRLNVHYARNYSLALDLEITLKGLRQLELPQG